MKKVLTVFLALTILLTAASCGRKIQTAEDYADKLVSGEVEPDAEIAQKDREPEYSAEVEPESDKEAEKTQPAVNLAVSDEDMGRLVDAADNDYKSFTVEPIDSPDFFVGKRLRVVATMQDHRMTNVYRNDIETEFTNNSLTIEYPSAEGDQKQNYIVYTIADSVKVSPKNRHFSYVAYGEDEITSETTDGTIGIMTLIKMREDVNMGDAAADTYIMLQETSNEGVYEIFKVME